MSSRPKVRPEEALAAHCTRWRPRPSCASQPTNVWRLFQNSVLGPPRPILPNSPFTQITLSPAWQCVIFSSQEVIKWTKSQMNNSIASCFVWLCNSVFYKSLKVKVVRKPRSGWNDNIKTDRRRYTVRAELLKTGRMVAHWTTAALSTWHEDLQTTCRRYTMFAVHPEL
jgi:hypothetical protein